MANFVDDPGRIRVVTTLFGQSSARGAVQRRVLRHGSLFR
jgi:hypothetical protein